MAICKDPVRKAIYDRIKFKYGNLTNYARRLGCASPKPVIVCITGQSPVVKVRLAIKREFGIEVPNTRACTDSCLKRKQRLRKTIVTRYGSVKGFCEANGLQYTYINQVLNTQWDNPKRLDRISNILASDRKAKPLVRHSVMDVDKKILEKFGSHLQFSKEHPMFAYHFRRSYAKWSTSKKMTKRSFLEKVKKFYRVLNLNLI